MKRVICSTDSPLTQEGFNKFFDEDASDDVKRQAAAILYKWYEMEDEEYMPDRDSILDMLDASTSPVEAKLVRKALYNE